VITANQRVMLGGPRANRRVRRCQIGFRGVGVGTVVQERQPLAGREDRDLDTVAAVDRVGDRHADVDARRIADGIECAKADERWASRRDRAFAQPAVEAWKALVGRPAQLRLARDARRDRDVGAGRTVLEHGTYASSVIPIRPAVGRGLIARSAPYRGEEVLAARQVEQRVHVVNRGLSRRRGSGRERSAALKRRMNVIANWGELRVKE